MGGMAARSGWRIGQQMRGLLTAVRQAKIDTAMSGSGTSDGGANGTGTASGAAVGGGAANGTVNGTVSGAHGEVAGEVRLAGQPGAGHAPDEAAAGGDDPGTGPEGRAASAPWAGAAAPGPSVPRWLQTAGGWAWRLLFIAIVAYLAYRVAARLAVVVLPCAAALLLTALLQPLTSRLRRAGMPTLAATWCTLLGAIIVLAGTITLVTIRVRAEYPGLRAQVRHTTHQLQAWLAGAPLHVRAGSLQKLSDKVLSYLGQHKSLVAGTVLTGGEIVFEILGGIVLMLFVTFFLLKDGARIWAWFSRVFGANRERADRAGRAAWQAVVYYVRGTVLVAAIHAVVIGSTLTIMGVPLVAALAVLVFLAAFVPLVGILFAGAVVVLITLATKGWIAAVIVLAVFVAEDQLESHLLQPFVVGRFVRLHPLAIILALAVGGVVVGIPGAVVAVPIAAAVTRAAPELRRRSPVPAAGPGPAPAPVPDPGPGSGGDHGGGENSDPPPGPR
jgi:predicted PurR-regulated permease PerM